MSIESSKLQVRVKPVEELVRNDDSSCKQQQATVNGCREDDAPLKKGANKNQKWFDGTKLHREYTIQIREQAAAKYSKVRHEATDENGVPATFYPDPLYVMTQLRFSTFRQNFASRQMQKMAPKSTALLPPRGMHWEDITHSITNVLVRANQMEVFLANVVNENGPAILRSDILQNALFLSDGDMSHLRKIAQKRQEEEEQIENAKRREEAEERNAIEKQMDRLKEGQERKAEALHRSNSKNASQAMRKKQSSKQATNQQLPQSWSHPKVFHSSAMRMTSN